MKNRIELYNIFYGKNYDKLYKGLSGFFFNQAHKNLENLNYNSNFIANKNNEKKQLILEIGPGRQLHYDYLTDKKKILKYFYLDTNLKNTNYLKKKYKSSNLFVHLKKMSHIKKNSLDRIICSHVLEHIFNPEQFILYYYKFLKKNGTFSITLPCDPGLLWRIGRLYNYLTFWKYKGVSKKEYYYHMAHEHINPIKNLITIIKYNFKNYSESFLPFKFASTNLNLMYNIVIFKE